jgi:cell division protein FtsI/penicillin-binding protein 2
MARYYIKSKGMIIALIAIWCIFVLFCFRLYSLQIVHKKKFIEIRDEYALKKFEIPGSRGHLIDRLGTPLTQNIDCVSVGIHPLLLRRFSSNKAGSEAIERKFADEISHIVKIPRNRILSKLNSNDRFEWIARKIPLLDQKHLELIFRKYSVLRAFSFYRKEKRYYPHGKQTASLIGFTGLDGIGLAGLEYWMEKIIKAPRCTLIEYRDAANRRLKNHIVQPCSKLNGKNVYLSLHLQLQKRVYDYLAAICSAKNILSGAVVIMNAKTGKILSLANYPTYDPNSYQSYPNEQWYHNPIFTQLVTPQWVLYATGVMIRSDFGLSNNPLFKEKLANPKIISNRDIVNLLQDIDKTVVNDYFSHLGFHSKTGLEFKNEPAGKCRPELIINNGSGLSITPLRCLTFLSTIANGGYNVIPSLLKYNINKIEYPIHANQRKTKIFLTGSSKIMKKYLTRAANINGLSVINGLGVKHGAITFTDYHPNTQIRKQTRNAITMGIITLIPSNETYCLLSIVKTKSQPQSAPDIDKMSQFIYTNSGVHLVNILDKSMLK